jgi:hypothetical protein
MSPFKNGQSQAKCADLFIADVDESNARVVDANIAQRVQAQCGDSWGLTAALNRNSVPWITKNNVGHPSPSPS